MPSPSFIGGVPQTMALPAVGGFQGLSILQAQRTYTLAGVTRDSSGVAVGGYTVYLFVMTGTVPTLAGMTVSDSNGNYIFSVTSGNVYWVIDYKAGSPDTGGVSLNTLVGV